MTTPTQTILDLLDAGHKLAETADAEADVRQSEYLVRRAIGYFNAAQQLLTAFAELHNELIDHPKFVAARKFSRRYSF
jgi:hypothetical protein